MSWWKNMWEWIKLIVLSQAVMAASVFQLPGIPRLRRDPINENDGWHRDGDVLNVQLQTCHPLGHDYRCEIRITGCKLDPQLDVFRTTNLFYEDVHLGLGSGSIAVIIFGIPTMLLLWIPSMIWNWFLHILEEHWGMSWRSRRVLTRLKGCISGAEYFAIRQALINRDNERL